MRYELFALCFVAAIIAVMIDDCHKRKNEIIKQCLEKSQEPKECLRFQY